MTTRFSSFTVTCFVSVGLVVALPLEASTPAPRCTAYASTLWASGPTPKLKLEAFSDGPTCAKAITVFAVRDASGKVLHSETYQSQFVATLGEARTLPQMRLALRDWIGIGANPGFHADLPNWLAGATAPQEREFPFTPDQSITRADYLAVKARRMPVLCYVQGMESLKCLVYRNGGLEPFGIQSFPG
jgi:hypothetical protein